MPKVPIKDRRYVKILGINVLSTSKVDLLTQIQKKIQKKQRFSIFTPNPELILATQYNQKLKEAVNSCTFSVPDGVGLNYASRFLYGKSLNVIPGRKLFLDLIKIAANNKWRVFLLGGIGKEATLTAKHLASLYPNIEVSYGQSYTLSKVGEPVTKIDVKLQKDVVKKISSFKPQLLFVALGNPKQELWIHKNLSRLNIGGAMAVGGTFRYLAGLSKLPPKWIEQVGLEWLWRLITEPKRFKRILNATLVFSLKTFWSKILKD